MKKIHKYHLPMSPMSQSEILVPSDIQPLRVDLQNRELCLWAIVDPDSPKKYITVTVIGTGGEVKDVGEYLNTVFASEYVFHIFIEKGF